MAVSSAVVIISFVLATALPCVLQRYLGADRKTDYDLLDAHLGRGQAGFISRCRVRWLLSSLTPLRARGTTMFCTNPATTTAR